MAILNFLFTGETTKYKVETWTIAPAHNPMSAVKIADVTLGVETAISSTAAGFDIRVYALPDVEMTGVNLTGTLAQPWKPPFKFTNLLNNQPTAYYILRLKEADFAVYGANLITVTPEIIAEVVTLAPFNRLHVMDEAALTAFSELDTWERSRGENSEKIYNRTVYIINLLQVPFELDAGLYPDEAFIKLGDFDTAIKTPLLNIDLAPIDLGQIVVNDLENNSSDYFAKYELFLPFVENSIPLEPSDVVGKTLKLEWVLDCYNGDAVLNIFNGGLEPFKTVKNTIGRNIPIKVIQDVELSLTGDNGVSSGVMGAYIKRSKPELVGGEFNNLITKSGVLGSESGFIKVENITLKTSAYRTEKENILSMLKNGVIIK